MKKRESRSQSSSRGWDITAISLAVFAGLTCFGFAREWTNGWFVFIGLAALTVAGGWAADIGYGIRNPGKSEDDDYEW